MNRCRVRRHWSSFHANQWPLQQQLAPTRLDVALAVAHLFVRFAHSVVWLYALPPVLSPRGLRSLDNCYLSRSLYIHTILLIKLSRILRFVRNTSAARGEHGGVRVLRHDP